MYVLYYFILYCSVVYNPVYGYCYYISEPFIYIFRTPHLSSNIISFYNHYMLCSQCLTNQYVQVIPLLRLVYTWTSIGYEP